MPELTVAEADPEHNYPTEVSDDGLTAQERLEKLTWIGAKGRYPEGLPDNVAIQIRHELTLNERLGYAPYFVTVESIVRFARSKAILCQSRGSAANSAVCFALGITVIDPVRQGLLFERFIREERREPPDIDVDFEHERREEVIQREVVEDYRSKGFTLGPHPMTFLRDDLDKQGCRISTSTCSR